MLIIRWLLGKTNNYVLVLKLKLKTRGYPFYVHKFHHLNSGNFSRHQNVVVHTYGWVALPCTSWRFIQVCILLKFIVVMFVRFMSCYCVISSRSLSQNFWHLVRVWPLLSPDTGRCLSVMFVGITWGEVKRLISLLLSVPEKKNHSR